MIGPLESGRCVVERIRKSGLSIYDPLDNHPELYLSNGQLQAVLSDALDGIDLNLALRTRSKVAKQAVAAALGYPIPKSFKKTRPRFVGQRFDTYIQKADNLQIWNEEIDASRRYVIIRVDDAQVIRNVKVISGEALAPLDTTGTLTSKYQAKLMYDVGKSVLVSEVDTEFLQERMVSGGSFLEDQVPFADLIPIADIYTRLKSCIGMTIPNPGHEQERNRGGGLHKLVQTTLGEAAYSDTGQFPDIIKQLVEVKLQTAATIDLGFVKPDDISPVAAVPQVRHCDVRYVVFYGHIDGKKVVLDYLVASNGERFFSSFHCFEGKQMNRKYQIHLPADFFDDDGG